MAGATSPSPAMLLLAVGVRRARPREHGGRGEEYWGVARSLARLFVPSGHQEEARELAHVGHGGGRTTVNGEMAKGTTGRGMDGLGRTGSSPGSRRSCLGRLGRSADGEIEEDLHGGRRRLVDAGV